MSVGLFQRIAEQSAGRVSLIKLCGLGEPALHPHLNAMVRLLRSHNIPVSLYTNGTLFDRYVPEEILEWGVDLLVVSADGTDERSFKRLRVGGDYWRLREKVAEFRKAREKTGKRLPHIEIRHVIMPCETAAMLKTFRDDWTDGLGDTVKFNLLEAPCSQGVIDSTRPPCRDIRREMYVRYNGRVPLCGFHIEWIGDVRSSTIEEIWHCSRIEEVRGQHASRNLSDLPFCKTCSFR
jgi:MoaA/NifB/PqqE/SkfB family radical SAM enzyme